MLKRARKNRQISLFVDNRLYVIWQEKFTREAFFVGKSMRIVNHYGEFSVAWKAYCDRCFIGQAFTLN